MNLIERIADWQRERRIERLKGHVLRAMRRGGSAEARKVSVLFDAEMAMRSDAQIDRMTRDLERKLRGRA